MPPGVSLWHSLLVRHAKSVKAVLQRASQAIDAQLSSGQPQAKLQTALARNTPKQPLHPLARIRQSQSRWYSTTRDAVQQSVRNFSSTSGRKGYGYDKASFPKSRVSASISQSSGRAPFASTLRPNLTGGALGRTAGGYALGSGRMGGARYFSHGPASQAQVVHNVSQGVRAFFLSGQKAQFDGFSERSGEKRYRAVSAVQDDAERKLRSVPMATPGSTLRYAVNPTITALHPLSDVAGFTASEFDSADHLNSSGVLDALSVDFSRALKDLAAVLNDLRRLSALGNLPITTDGVTLQVHFPGCDADTVERLCAELGVQRGTVVQDADFDAFAGTEIALLFPFAPSEDSSECESLFEYAVPAKRLRSQQHVICLDDMLAPSASSPAFSTQSDSGMEHEEDESWEYHNDVEDVLVNKYTAWSASDYESVSLRSSSRSASAANRNDPLEYQGFEGIYRFLEELEAVRR